MDIFSLGLTFLRAAALFSENEIKGLNTSVGEERIKKILDE